MREAISNTAELGAALGGPRVVDESIREKMREVLAEVRSGRFAEALRKEEESGYKLLEKARAEAGKKPIERVFDDLQRLGGN